MGERKSIEEGLDDLLNKLPEEDLQEIADISMLLFPLTSEAASRAYSMYKEMDISIPAILETVAFYAIYRYRQLLTEVDPQAVIAMDRRLKEDLDHDLSMFL